MRGDPSDDELLRATAAGDRWAFEQYYRRNAPWLEIRLRRRCGDAGVAADGSRAFRGGPTRAVGSTYGPPAGAEPFLGLDTSSVTITGELYREGEWSAVHWQPELGCESPDAHERYRWMTETAAIWGRGDEPAPGWAPETVDGHAALLAMPLTQQKVWIGELIAAAGACDQAALDQLAERLA